MRPTLVSNSIHDSAEKHKRTESGISAIKRKSRCECPCLICIVSFIISYSDLLRYVCFLNFLISVHVDVLSEKNISPWYKNYFTQAKKLGIINSTEDIGSYNDKMTREKMRIILFKLVFDLCKVTWPASILEISIISLIINNS